MNVPFRLKLPGIDLDTFVGPEVAAKVALALAGVAAGTAVIAAGAACGNAGVIKLGAGMAAASVMGAGMAVGRRANDQAQLPGPSAGVGVAGG